MVQNDIAYWWFYLVLQLRNQFIKLMFSKPVLPQSFIFNEWISEHMELVPRKWIKRDFLKCFIQERGAAMEAALQIVYINFNFIFL